MKRKTAKSEFEYGLKPQECAALRGALAASPRVERAVLFGSRATGTFSPASDVDLALYGDGVTLADQADLASRIEDLNLPVPVDLLRVATVDSDALRKHIEQHGKLFYQKAATNRASKEKSLDLASEWGTAVLGDYFTLQRGTTYKGRLLGQPGPILLGLATIQRNGGFRTDSIQTYGGESPAKLIVNPGELYLSLKDVTQSADLLGAVARLPHDRLPGRLTQDTVKLQPINADVPLDYLYWLLRTPQYRSYCRAHATGTTNLGLAREDFLVFPAPQPTYVQSRIVETLNQLDDKIELNRKMNETLEAMARALFQSWFVDFDPVRAKAEGRPTGLPADIAALFPDSFENSELGPIPKGWSVGKFSDVANNSRRGISPGEIPEQTPYIALEHMPRKCIALSEWGIADGVESGKFAFNANDILFGKLRPYFHKVGIAPINGVCSTDILVLAARAPEWFGFVLGHASSDAFVEHANAGSTGTKMPRTNWTDMARYPVILPPEKLAKAYTAKIRPAISRIIASIHQNQTLAVLRDTLLPKLISGEVRVGQAQQAMMEAGI